MHNWAKKWASERPRQYTMTWVTFCNFCSVAQRSVMYGWNIWVDQLVGMFYGTSEYTMARGGPVYAFSLIGVSMAIANTIMTFMRMQDPNKTFNILGFKFRGGQHRAFYIVGLIASTISLIVMGLAVQYTQLWLLYIGCVAFGFLAAGMQPLQKFQVTMSYYNVGQKGVGSGFRSAWPGIWAASFSYWGSALSDDLSVQSAIYISAAISALVSLVPIPFANVEIPKLSKYHQRSKERLELESDEAKTEVIPPVYIPLAEVLRTRQFWLMWLAFFIMMIPGFGIKYLISPMLADVFDASRLVQQTASFLFLILYALARFLGGALNWFFDAMLLMRVITFLAVPLFIVQGWLATQYDSTVAMYFFIVCQCFVGMLLGASKVLITLLWLKIFGAINYLDSFPVLLTSWASAQLIGPILGWWSLSGHGVNTDPTYKSSLGDAVAIYCYASAGAQAAAFLTSFLITNIDFAKYQHVQKQSNNSTNDVEKVINDDRKGSISPS
jgi:nitrate/nitrite transporter NarK